MRFSQSSVRWLAAVIVAAISCKGDSLDPSGGDVASVVITPPTATVAVGANVTLVAEVLDGTGKTLTGVKVVWASADLAIATVRKALQLIPGDPTLDTDGKARVKRRVETKLKQLE